MRTKITFWVSMLCFLAMAILLTIYLAWLFYPLEISWLGLADKVYLKPETIQHNFNILLNYLTNPFQQTLSMPDFRSSADGLHHFQAVKYLFHLAQFVFLASLPTLYFLVRDLIKKGYLLLFSKSLLLLAILPVLIGLLTLLVGFDTFFTLFHQILFVGDNTWLFDPTVDPVIWILPEEFFLHAFVLFFVLYEVCMFGLYFLSKRNVRLREVSSK